MGLKNYLIAGGSGTGKTTVAEELQRRGYHVLHGDRELAFCGDPQTGKPIEVPTHKSEKDKILWRANHHIWNIDKVKSITADYSHPISFFCGGARNYSCFIDVFDGVFILEVRDLDTIYRRMDERVARDPTDFGGKPEEKEIVAQLHLTKEDIPDRGIVINSCAPVTFVVNEIISKCGE